MTTLAAFTTTDYTVLIVYLIAVVAIGIRLGRGQSSLAGYFLANRKAPWIVACFSIIATDFSAISYMGMPAWVYEKDLKWYEYFDQKGLEITNYPWAGDVYHDFQTRSKVNPRTGDPTKPSPLFGHGPDFGYFYYGSIWYGDELWNGGRMRDYNEDGELDEYDSLVWNDTEPQPVQLMPPSPGMPRNFLQKQTIVPSASCESFNPYEIKGFDFLEKIATYKIYYRDEGLAGQKGIPP